MSYVLRNGKLVKREKLQRRPPQREPINMNYQRELWHPGPVRDMARAIAKAQFTADLRAKGRDPRNVSYVEMELGITRILYNTGEIYLLKAKEVLR